MKPEDVAKICKDLTEAKDKVIYIESTIEFITKKIGYTSFVNVDFGGIYKRSSKRFWLTEAELLNILNNRLTLAKENLTSAQNNFNALDL